MTEITATKTNNHYRLEVDGHADTHDACVMVSVLAQTLLVAAQNNPAVDVVYSDLQIGHAVIEYLTEEDSPDMRCILIGLMQVQHDHPEGVTIEQNIF